ncbi:RNA exonuclease 4-like protein [Leptotrombidium deliense]|uniref:RNA exonuclease 4-like protein n=1 Tax=Leptotrombidium deliense TaxID=299467 RepID=A0A443SB99_9ACAR|nr:RNA exonuclease 4-like protein [Leptotrombidium deliense]
MNMNDKIESLKNCLKEFSNYETLVFFTSYVPSLNLNVLRNIKKIFLREIVRKSIDNLITCDTNEIDHSLRYFCAREIPIGKYIGLDIECVVAFKTYRDKCLYNEWLIESYNLNLDEKEKESYIAMKKKQAKMKFEMVPGSVSLVDEKGKLVFFSYVYCDSVLVHDYVTDVSGLNKSLLDDAPCLTEIQDTIKRLTVGKVIIGAAIHNDLKALKFDHPNVEDVQTFYTSTNDNGNKQPISLKRLWLKYFPNHSQLQAGIHSCTQDARMSLLFYKKAIGENFEDVLTEIEQEHSIVVDNDK